MDSEISEPTKALFKRGTSGTKMGGRISGMKNQYRELYTEILKQVIFFLECKYGLRSPPSTPGLVIPAARDKVSIAHHFAAYLAISQVTATIWKIPNEETEILLPSPARGGSDVKTFKGVLLAPWMREIPNLTKQYIRAMRDKGSWCGINNIRPISWLSQIVSSTPVDEFLKAVSVAEDVAEFQTIELQPMQTPPSKEEVEKYNLLQIYAKLQEEERQRVNASVLPP